ncbi:hypothetical protein [Chelativorans sp.]|uniref:hypothetical protein n=1 Tax=Chelativorans sp. TaxID=2203393 RepID=UPI0028120307|nr:hypothetical protein [Chelativorans sp.]
MITSDEGSVTNSTSVDCVHIQNSTITGDVTNTASGVLNQPANAGLAVDQNSTVTGNVQNDGQISGAEGIRVSASTIDGLIENNNSIAGDIYGIRLVNGALAGGLTNSGTVAGATYGMVLESGAVFSGDIVNSGTFQGGGSGIALIDSTMSGRIINSGDVIGTTAISIVLVNTNVSGGISNEASGQIIGDEQGLYVSGAAGSPLTITNGGLIRGTSAVGIYLLDADLGGGIANEASGQIIGGQYGISAG